MATPGAHRVGHARDQRHLGADDDEVGVEVVGELRDLRGVGGVDREAERDLGDAGVAGRGEHLGRRRRTLQRPHERVLAPARPDDEDAHGQAARGRTTVWARSGPTPTKLIGTPTASSMKRR